MRYDGRASDRRIRNCISLHGTRFLLSQLGSMGHYVTLPSNSSCVATTSLRIWL